MMASIRRTIMGLFLFFCSFMCPCSCGHHSVACIRGDMAMSSLLYVHGFAITPKKFCNVPQHNGAEM